MNRLIFKGLATAAISMLMIGCGKEDGAGPDGSANCATCGTKGAIPLFPAEDEAYVKHLEQKGFDRREIARTAEGFIVEGDIFMSYEQLKGEMGLAKTAQRVDANRVNQETVVRMRVQIHTSISGWAAHVRQAMVNWNVSNSKVRFEEVTANPQIIIAADTWTGLPTGMRNLSANTCGIAGFPTGGNPFNFVSINMDNTDLAGDPARRTRTITHEMGHCIGMHHTNGTSGTQLAGTPATDALSLMNGGECNFGQLNLSAWDRVTANFLYPKREDLIVKEKTTGTWHVARSTGTAFTNLGVWVTGFAIGEGYDLLSADANGDGRTDLLAKEKTTGTWHVARSTGTGFTNLGAWINGWAIGQGYSLLTADVNGDGRGDLIAKEKTTGTWHVALSNGTVFTPAGEWLHGFAIGTGYNLYTGDIDGDGRGDVIAHEAANGRLHVARSNGSAFVGGAQWGTGLASGTGVAILASDVTGDGRTDIVAKNNAGTWFTYVNSGSSFQAAAQWGSGFAIGTGYKVFAADVTGDGRGDLIAKDEATASGKWFVYPSTGTAFANHKEWITGFAMGAGYNSMVGDASRQ